MVVFLCWFENVTLYVEPKLSIWRKLHKRLAPDQGHFWGTVCCSLAWAGPEHGVAYLSKSLRCNKDIEVVTQSRLLQEDSQTQGKPLLGISPQRLRKVSGGGWSPVCTNTSDAVLTDPEHLCGVRASGETRPVGLVCCGMWKERCLFAFIMVSCIFTTLQ